MSEVIATFLATDGWHERTYPTAKTTDSSLCDLSQKCFEFAERHLDRVEVGRVLGQIAKRRAVRFNRLANASSFVRRKVVDHDDILALEGRGQALFDISQELGSVH